jgi:hypothetical protein
MFFSIVKIIRGVSSMQRWLQGSEIRNPCDGVPIPGDRDTSHKRHDHQ